MRSLLKIFDRLKLTASGWLTYVVGWAAVLVGIGSLLLHLAGDMIGFSSSKLMDIESSWQLLSIGLIAVGLRRSNAKMEKKVDDKQNAIDRILNLLRDTDK